MAGDRRRTAVLAYRRRLPSVLLSNPLLQSLRGGFGPALLLELGALIQLARLMRLFVLELVVALESAGGQAAGVRCIAHCTSRLLAVAAVAEAAPRRQRLDVGERGVRTLDAVPQLQLAHPGRVDQHTGFREQHQLARRARVPSAAVRLPHVLGAQKIVPNQSI